MSIKARDLLKNSLRLIGVVASGETPSAEEVSDGLVALNELIDNWSTQSLLLPSKTIEDFALTGAQTYTMGVGGTWATARPQRIFHIATVDLSNNPANEIAVEILNQDQWSSVHQKTVTGTIATKCYVNYANPLVSLSFWPVPTIANKMRIYSWKPLSQVATADTLIDLPPGYQMALRYNLAVILSPEYGKPIAPGIAAIASTAKEEIQRMNFEPIYMACDPAAVGRGRAWDWRTGE